MLSVFVMVFSALVVDVIFVVFVVEVAAFVGFRFRFAEFLLFVGVILAVVTETAARIGFGLFGVEAFDDFFLVFAAFSS